MTIRMNPVYDHEVDTCEILSAEEELDLIIKSHHGDKAARDKLVMHNQRMIIKVANKYYRFFSTLEDLVQEGNLGLIIAIDRFDTNKGERLSTYSMHYIGLYIRDYVVANSHIVHFTRNSNTRNLIMAIKKLSNNLSNSLTNDQIRELKDKHRTTHSNVVCIESLITKHDAYFDTSDFDPEDSTHDMNGIREDNPMLAVDSEIDLLIDVEHQLYNNKLLRDQLSRNLSSLENDIVVSYWMNDERTSDIANRYHVSSQHIAKTRLNALHKMQSFLKQFHHLD